MKNILALINFFGLLKSQAQIAFNNRNDFLKELTIILSLVFLTLLGCQEKSINSEKSSESKTKTSSEKLKLNQNKYRIQIGDTVKIYYSTNSCCQNCFPRLDELKFIKYIGRKIEIKPDNQCDGCNSLSSINFIGTAKGIEKVYYKQISPMVKCDSIKELQNFEMYTIVVN
jgi:hypothetical protein